MDSTIIIRIYRLIMHMEKVHQGSKYWFPVPFFSIFLYSLLHLSAKIYNFPLEKALNEERRMAYEERIYFVVADKRD